MTRPSIDAHVSEIDGPHYEVKLKAVPRVGELINLYSHADMKSKDPPFHKYEVVAVRHSVSDVIENDDIAVGTYHVTLIVKTSESEYFSRNI